MVYLKGKEGRSEGGLVSQKEGAGEPALEKGNKRLNKESNLRRWLGQV